MRIITKSLEDFGTGTITIGYAGENEHTQVDLDCSSVFSQYPEAIPALTVHPHIGDAYPAIAVRDGDHILWDILDSDLISSGVGEAQLTFTQNNIVCKSCIGMIRIDRSIDPTEETPTPVENWMVQANTALNGIPQTINTALAEAKASGMFDGRDGEDGISPTANVSKTGNTATVTITDKNGTTTTTLTDGQDGEDGEDGISPSASVSKNGSVATITITDRNGTTTAEIRDGEDVVSAIDDDSTATDKVWSANKLNTEVSGLQTAVNAKYTKPVNGIPASDLAPGTIPTTGVFDVLINGSSIVNSGAANIPIAANGVLGVMKPSNGLSIESDGTVTTSKATYNHIRQGENVYSPIVPDNQHQAAFYGLAKASGADMASSSNPVGTYTEDAKDKIMKMIGILDMIAPYEAASSASRAYVTGECFIHSGKLYRAIAGISIGTTFSSSNCEQTTLMAEIARARG